MVYIKAIKNRTGSLREGNHIDEQLLMPNDVRAVQNKQQRRYKKKSLCMARVFRFQQ